MVDGGGEALVRRQRVPLGAVRLGDRLRPVGRAAVDHEHAGRRQRLGRHAVQAGAEQRLAVEIRDDEIDGGAHGRIMTGRRLQRRRSSARCRRPSSACSKPMYSEGQRNASRASSGGHADDVLGTAVLLHVQPDDLGAIVPEQPHGGGVFAAAVEFLQHGRTDERARDGTLARAHPAPRCAVLHIGPRACPATVPGRSTVAVRPLVDGRAPRDAQRILGS